MRVFNYANYARVFEYGMLNPNMTEVAKVLLEPIINRDGVVNQSGNPYTVDSQTAISWYKKKANIPRNIQIAASDQNLIDSIGDEFASNILGVATSPNKEPKMYSEMVKLVRESDLAQDAKDELLRLYSDGDRPEFLGRALLFALAGDNRAEDAQSTDDDTDEDIVKFKNLIKKKYPKPKTITPPAKIEVEEVPYVRELYRVYGELTGEVYSEPDELNGHRKFRRDFDQQRKCYYKAETIRRELRDTIRLDEEDGFGQIKDEVFAGVIATRNNETYTTGYQRLCAVMQQASSLPLSNNLQNITLDWIGPGEKQGVCHMLVNDDLLFWVDDDDEPDTTV